MEERNTRIQNAIRNARHSEVAIEKTTFFRGRLFDRTKVDWDHLMFSNTDLRRLILPLMFEQLLNALMGTADTMMVSRIGSAAISAVSLTDSINVLFIQMFTAIASGGTILCSQYLGQNNKEGSSRCARQILLTIMTIATVIGAVCFFFRRGLLSLIFGQVEQAVMDGALTYFKLTALSFPFLAMFQAGSAFFRAGKNTRIPMTISVISNLMNIAGNALFIFGFGWGIFGAALSTLISRIFSGIGVMLLLRMPRQPIVITGYHTIRPDFGLIRKILAIGIPSGIENGMFQFGKLAIQSSVSTLGTTAIAAQAMTAMLEGFNGVLSMAIGVAMMTVVGQALGADKKEEAKYYIVKLTVVAEFALILNCLAVYALTRPVLFLAGMEPESARMCLEMMTVITIVKPLTWAISFIPVNGLRAAGDVRFTMITGTITMWFCRVALATFLIRGCGFGPIAVWIGMFTDWTLRSIIFAARFLSGHWLKHTLI